MPFPNPIPLLIPVILWLLVGPKYIQFLQKKMYGQFIREDGPQHHHKKAGTPTMGGVLILITVLVTLLGFVLLDAHLCTMNILWCTLAMVTLGALGFLDDFKKIAKKHNKGITGWTKLAIQVTLGLLIGLWVMVSTGRDSISLFGLGWLHMGWFYPLFTSFVLTGGSNAYNLTDGVDGLAASTGFVTFVALSFMLMHSPDLMLVSLLLAGGCLGFLYFNRHPARIFMGDTGSLALGAVMAALVILGKIELSLALAGIVYIVEAMSVIIQVLYFKVTHGKRIFKMSPIHHHFELSGWKEPKIVLTFTLLQALFSLLAVLLYNKG